MSTGSMALDASTSFVKLWEGSYFLSVSLPSVWSSSFCCVWEILPGFPETSLFGGLFPL